MRYGPPAPPSLRQKEKRNEKLVGLSLPPNGGLRLRLHRWFYGGSMTDREIMQQALEALEAIWEGGLENYPDTLHENIMDALRERLAQPEEHTTRIVTDANGRKYITNEPRLRE